MFPVHARPRPAFTLIELLIVVAIIAILAAIAVPNFLEAQTRAHTSAGDSNDATNGTVSNGGLYRLGGAATDS